MIRDIYCNRLPDVQRCGMRDDRGVPRKKLCRESL